MGSIVAGGLELTLFVTDANVEIHGRLAQADCKGAVDIGEQPVLDRLQLVFARAACRRLAELLCSHAQVAREIFVQVARVGGIRGLGHCLLGAHAVLFDERAEHVPLAAVT